MTNTESEIETVREPVIAEGTLERVTQLAEGQKGIVILDRTPFYAESGGQVGDTGRIMAAEATATATDTGKASGLHLHHVEVTEGKLVVGQGVSASIKKWVYTPF